MPGLTTAPAHAARGGILRAAAIILLAASVAYAGWTFTLRTQSGAVLHVYQHDKTVMLDDQYADISLTPAEARMLASALNAAADGKLEP